MRESPRKSTAQLHFENIGIDDCIFIDGQIWSNATKRFFGRRGAQTVFYLPHIVCIWPRNSFSFSLGNHSLEFIQYTWCQSAHSTACQPESHPTIQPSSHPASYVVYVVCLCNIVRSFTSPSNTTTIIDIAFY